MDERLLMVTYDIADQKRWRSVFSFMKGYGEWLQLSVFQCRLSPKRRAELIATLDQLIHHQEDHVLIFDLGPVASVTPRVTSLGKEFSAISRAAIVI
ncbi:MAG: CRISPR-associated endonuclease Cas2 [Gammaproteobacteria bacterium]|nr:CRISPR-associated endonuclease Cas2 [Gammaproteobacteria bacterium]